MPRRGVQPARGDNQEMVVLPKRGVTPKGGFFKTTTEPMASMPGVCFSTAWRLLLAVRTSIVEMLVHGRITQVEPLLATAPRQMASARQTLRRAGWTRCP